MKDVAGSVGAAPIWHNVMQRALQGVPPKQFPVPQGIQRSQGLRRHGHAAQRSLPGPARRVFRRRSWPAAGALRSAPAPAHRQGHRPTGHRIHACRPGGDQGFPDLPTALSGVGQKHGFPQPNVTRAQVCLPAGVGAEQPGQEQPGDGCRSGQCARAPARAAGLAAGVRRGPESHRLGRSQWAEAR